MNIRFPKYCGKCQTFDHFAKDCTRVPNLGKSQAERDFDAMISRDNRVILTAALYVVLALVLFGFLERVPA